MGGLMATKEMLTLFGDHFPCFNVTTTVGAGAINAPDDVMLIQAMFNFIAEGERNGSTLGITSRRELPELTGRIESKTLAIIHSYQARWSRLLLNVDGKIHPAHYAGRDLQLDGSTRRMAITLLHQHAQGAAALMNEPDYTTALPDMFPKMRTLIRFL
jgi:hypothetical protein